MYAFYAFGITDLQDLIPLLLASLKRGKQCWFCIFDNLLSKKQFYYYSKEEIINFLEEICENNNLSKPNIGFFHCEDKKKFTSMYSEFNPEVVFIQNILHKSISWYPTAKKSKVVHVAWHKDGARHIADTPYNIWFNAVRKEMDLKYYGAHGLEKIPSWLFNRIRKKEKLLSIKAEYFGNFRLEHLNYVPTLKNFPEKSTLKENKNICFVVEAHLRSDLEFRKETGKFVDKIIDFLHKNNYYIIWKTREKGYPKGKWCSPLDVATKKPDFVIDKDLNYPSSLVYVPLMSNICLTINSTNAIYDLQEINNNSYLLHPPNLPEHEYKIYQRRFEGSVKYLQLKNESSWNAFKDLLDKKDITNFANDNFPSTKLMEKIEESLK